MQSPPFWTSFSVRFWASRVCHLNWSQHVVSESRISSHEKMSFIGRKEGNVYVLFNEALNTFYLWLYFVKHMIKEHSGRKEMFYLWLYGIRHMVKEHSDSERGNPVLPHGLIFPINSKGSFICTIPQTG